MKPGSGGPLPISTRDPPPGTPGDGGWAHALKAKSSRSSGECDLVIALPPTGSRVAVDYGTYIGADGQILNARTDRGQRTGRSLAPPQASPSRGSAICRASVPRSARKRLRGDQVPRYPSRWSKVHVICIANGGAANSSNGTATSR